MYLFSVKTIFTPHLVGYNSKTYHLHSNWTIKDNDLKEVIA